MARKPSLYPTDSGCFICRNPNTETHHIYPGYGRRQVSDAEGCTIQLCHMHHNGSDYGVHFDRRLDRWLRADCQRRWERREGIDEPNHETFIALMGRNYIE